MTLASIQKIEKISPIPGADSIDVAKVLGWEVVVRKGEFKEGDLCIYVEIDSLLPRREWSEFLFKTPKKNTQVFSGKGDEGDINLETYRLRTIKLRGQISQGLVLPITVVAMCSWNHIWHYLYPIDDADAKIINVGDDVTDLLEIRKYEKPIPNINLRSGIRAKGAFPNFLRKTDEIRIQSAPELLEKLKGKPYYITQKMDGTSATYYRYKGEFGVCSRNMDLKDPRTPSGIIQWIKREIRKIFGKTKKSVPSTDIYWRMAFKYKIDEWLPEGYAIQGEICGPGIQGNKMGLEENKLFIFNVFNIKDQKYINPYEWSSNDWDDWESGLENVPHLPVDMPFNFTLEQLLEKSKGNYSNGTPQEGIVVRSIDQTISFKVVNNEFLLKYGE